MAQSYIPEGTMLICTEMKTPMDNTIISSRSKTDVFKASKKVYLLTEKDYKLEKAFVCNINSKFWGGLKALCTIVAIGALMIATVATGGLALVAFGVAVAAVGVSAFASDREIAHDCDITLQSKWINVHDKVKINGSFALLQNSKMICKKGGALTMVVDPVLARAAAQKIAANNQAEYEAHLNSQMIQGTMFLISSKGDPRALAVGLPLTIFNYAEGEDKKIKDRANAIEQRITNSNPEDEKGALASVLGAVPDQKATETAVRDAIIGTGAEVVYKNPAIVTAVINYPAVVSASMRSAYPTAALRLNSSLVFAGVQRSFTNPGISNGLKEGFLWGMAGAAVDGGFDVYENSLYDDTINYFTEFLSVQNQKSKGINIIAKTK
ncbi:DUF4280 domain-containing protein [Chryseobacterium sp. 09-1422]|jgi:hypothetical protein|uniref:DUF4280 domain-containing protein n=1 Tax=Chryseobacterium kimseyorum TaxID=2984028 RepID=A0ABT3I3Y1_9FLAO|nr:DUF4280 domain-containing protein [Chryseobacterium kimseyorum]MCW3170779.1 DUF4280 domain-containing protein [Chryseobacterium kimseyorum]